MQVYLETDDSKLLARVSSTTGLSKAEIMRRGLRRISSDLLAESTPGASLNQLLGALGGEPAAPADLAARHDEYLYPEADDSGGD